MSGKTESRDPVICEIEGRRYHFYCRLFADEDSARRVFDDLVRASTRSSASVLLIREPDQDLAWAVLFFSETQIELLAFSPLIHDRGRPYRSRFLVEAARRREAILAFRARAEQSFFPPGLLESIDPDKLL